MFFVYSFPIFYFIVFAHMLCGLKITVLYYCKNKKYLAQYLTNKTTNNILGTPWSDLPLQYLVWLHLITGRTDCHIDHLSTENYTNRAHSVAYLMLSMPCLDQW